MFSDVRGGHDYQAAVAAGVALLKKQRDGEQKNALPLMDANSSNPLEASIARLRAEA